MNSPILSGLETYLLTRDIHNLRFFMVPPRRTQPPLSPKSRPLFVTKLDPPRPEGTYVALQDDYHRLPWPLLLKNLSETQESIQQLESHAISA